MAQIFKKYAQYYDALYQEKDYPGECDYLTHLWKKFSDVTVKTVLDLGCGTGNHSYHLSKRGYDVVGIDRSEEMLARAQKKMQSLPNPVQLVKADLTSFKINNTFDAVISMFAVVGYLTDNKQLCSLFESVRKHLNAGGLFVFDVWYGPAVLQQLPETREVNIETCQYQFRRRAVPSIDYTKNLVQVNYTLSTPDHVAISRESHRMRYFFLPELELMAEFYGFSLHRFFAFRSFDNPSETDWNITVILKK